MIISHFTRKKSIAFSNEKAILCPFLFNTCDTLRSSAYLLHPSASTARGKTGRLKRAPCPSASAGVFLPQIPVYRCERRRHQIAGYLYCHSQNRKNVHGEPHVYCTCRFPLQGTRSAMLYPCLGRPPNRGDHTEDYITQVALPFSENSEGCL